MATYLELGTYFFVYTICLVLFNLIGKIFFNILFSDIKLNRMYFSGFTIILGFLFTSSLIACSITKFSSIYNFQFFIFIGILVYGIFHKKIYFNLNINKKVILFYTLNFISFIFLFHLNKKNYHFDFIFWGKLSKNIFEVKIESLNSLYFEFLESKKLMLYHYSDYWVNGAITSVTKQPEVYTLIYSIYPIIIGSSLLSIYGVLESNRSNKYLNILLAVGLLFGIKIFTTTDPESISTLLPRYRGIYEASQLKTSITYLPILISYFLYKRKVYFSSFLFLSICPFIYPTTTISISLSFIVLLTSFLLQKNEEKKYKFYATTIFFIYCLFTLYLKIKTNNPHLRLEIEIKPVKYYLIQFIELNYKLFYEALIPLLLILAHIIYNYIRKKNRFYYKSIIFSFSLYLGIVASMFFVTIHKPFLDNNQIINNITPVFLTLLFLDLIFEIKSLKIIYLTILIFMIHICLNLKNSNIKTNTKFKNNQNIHFIEDFKKKCISKINKLENINSIYFSNHVKDESIYNPGNKFDFLSKEYKFDLPYIITNKENFVYDKTFKLNNKILNLNINSDFRYFISHYKINVLLTESSWNNFIKSKLATNKYLFEESKEKQTNSSIFIIKKNE